MVTPNMKKNRIKSDHSLKLKLNRKSGSGKHPNGKSILLSNSNCNEISKRCAESNINRRIICNEKEYQYDEMQKLLSNALWNNKVSQHDVEEFGQERKWIGNDGAGDEFNGSKFHNSPPTIVCMIGGYQDSSTPKTFGNKKFIEYLLHIKLYEIEIDSTTDANSGSIGAAKKHNPNSNQLASLMVLRRYSAFEELKDAILQLDVDLNLQERKEKSKEVCEHEHGGSMFKERLMELFPEKHPSIRNSLFSYFFPVDSSSTLDDEYKENPESDCINDTEEVFLIKRQYRLQYWLNFVLFYLATQYQYFQNMKEEDEAIIPLANLNKVRHLLVLFLSTP